MKLTAIARDAQHWADRTRQTTIAVRMRDGSVRFTLEGYPIKGALLHTAKPAAQARLAA